MESERGGHEQDAAARTSHSAIPVRPCRSDAMLIGNPVNPKSGEVTSRSHYLNRRALLRRGAILAGSAAATGMLYRALSPRPAAAVHGAKLPNVVKPGPDAERA